MFLPRGSPLGSHMARSAVIKPAYTAGRQTIGVQAKRQLRYKTVADGVAETSREPVSTTSIQHAPHCRRCA